jgi:hypothetical protein
MDILLAIVGHLACKPSKSALLKVNKKRRREDFITIHRNKGIAKRPSQK